MVKTTVIEFRAEFQAILAQLEMLAMYKDIHDLLHTLEYTCYQGCLREERNFPEDSNCLIYLDSYKLNLQNIISGVEKIIAQGRPAFDNISWHQDLIRALECLDEAIEKEEKKPLEAANWFMKRILGIQPSHINAALVSTAKVLRLHDLVEGMRNIENIIENSELESEKRNQIQKSIKSLAQLDDNLTILVKEHDNWQKIDLQLRRIETETKNASDFSELDRFWRYFKEDVEKQYQDSQESWAISLKKESERLDQAIIDQNIPKVEQYFSSYCTRAKHQFYKIDHELKNFCGNLREVGNPLAYLLRMIE